jgi:voltage-gated potassium channel
VTTTTVGYGDLVPESVIGRSIGFLLMLAGIGIIGILTANIASLFLDPDHIGSVDTLDDAVDADDDEEDDDLRAQLAELNAKLDRVMARLEAGDGR